MTNELSTETKDYIRYQLISGEWECVPEYLGTFPALPLCGSEKSPFAVHKSLTQPGMIAFYDSVEKAEARRETIMKVGRFLTRAEEEKQEERVSSLEQEIECLDEALEALENIE